MRVRCYINYAYIYSGVISLLQAQGLKPEAYGMDPKGLEDRRDDIKIRYVDGTIDRSIVGNLWKVRGLEIMKEVK